MENLTNWDLLIICIGCAFLLLVYKLYNANPTKDKIILDADRVQRNLWRSVIYDKDESSYKND